MRDAIQQALATVARVAGQSTIVYRRGERTCQLTGFQGHTTWPVDDERGLAVEVVTADWLVAPDELHFNGTHIEPRAGDTLEVIEQAPGVGESKRTTYTVGAPTGAQPFRYTDPHHARLRIHTHRTMSR